MLCVDFNANCSKCVGVAGKRTKFKMVENLSRRKWMLLIWIDSSGPKSRKKMFLRLIIKGYRPKRKVCCYSITILPIFCLSSRWNLSTYLRSLGTVTVSETQVLLRHKKKKNPKRYNRFPADFLTYFYFLTKQNMEKWDGHNTFCGLCVLRHTNIDKVKCISNSMNLGRVVASEPIT